MKNRSLAGATAYPLLKDDAFIIKAGPIIYLTCFLWES